MESDAPALTKKELKKLKKKQQKQKLVAYLSAQKRETFAKVRKREDSPEDVQPVQGEQKSFAKHGVKRTRRFDDDEAENEVEETTSNRKNSGEDFEDQFEDEFEEEIKVETKDDWEDQDEEMKEAALEVEAQDTVGDLAANKKVWLGDEKLTKDEELVYENAAYEMIHRATVEWPSLSIDILLKERFVKESYSEWFPSEINQPSKDSSAYPFDVYVVAGSQAVKRTDNKLYVMKWTNLTKTLNEGEGDDDEDNEEAKLYYEGVPHKGAVNRLRAMHGSNIVATWGDEGDVSIFDMSKAIAQLETKWKSKSNSVSKSKKYSSLLSKFHHKIEGYALDWSPLRLGLLASGGCDKDIYLYEPTGSDFTEFKKHPNPLKGHKDSVEDLQFSPKQEYVLASCSVDKTIKLWDLRENKWKPQMSFNAHDSDVNVISWNSECPYLIASGSDDGSFKVWDLRKLQKDIKAKPITNIKWHNAPITSIQFQPREECVLAVSSADNKLTIWDFSVEPESGEAANPDIPPQLMFLHLGQENIKELRFHQQRESVLITTAQDSYNIFKPNFDPDMQSEGDDSDGENERRRMELEAKELQKRLDNMELEAK